MGTWERGNGSDERRREYAGRFEELHVWQTARGLAIEVYRAAESQRLAKDFALGDQMKRAAVSISSNIAEGYERGSRRQQIEACYIAKGSAGELRSQVRVAHDVGLLDAECHAALLEARDKCTRQLANYIAHRKRTQTSIPGDKFSRQKA